MGLRRFGCPWSPAGLFPNTTWLVPPGGVCGRRSNGDILRLLFIVTPELGSLEFPLFLLWGPATNSSASSIIIPWDTHRRQQSIKKWKDWIFDEDISLHKVKVYFIFSPSYPAWKDSQMCAGVWAGQGRSPSVETASFLGTPDSFPSEPLEYCAGSLTTTGDVFSINKTLQTISYRFILVLSFFGDMLASLMSIEWLHISAQPLDKSSEIFINWIYLIHFFAFIREIFLQLHFKVTYDYFKIAIKCKTAFPPWTCCFHQDREYLTEPKITSALTVGRYTFVLPSDQFLWRPQQIGAHSGELIQKVPSWDVVGISISLRLYILWKHQHV